MSPQTAFFVFPLREFTQILLPALRMIPLLIVLFCQKVHSQSPSISLDIPGDGNAYLTLDTDPNDFWQLEQSDDLSSWELVLKIRSTNDLNYTTPLEDDPRYFRLHRVPPALPANLTYRGETILLSGTLGFADKTLGIDLDGDGLIDDSVVSDESGDYILPLDVSTLGDSAVIRWIVDPVAGVNPAEDFESATLTREAGPNRATAVPTLAGPSPNNRSSIPQQVPSICACEDCDDDLFLLFNHTYTPIVHDVELATGTLRYHLPITSFPSRILNFNLEMVHTSGVDYSGPFGESVSHSYQMMIVRNGALSGSLITSDLRVFEIASEDGVNWLLPEGFFSELKYDAATKRWKLAHYAGETIEFFEGRVGEPGLPISLTEPNGNRVSFAYSPFGLLAEIKTSLGQGQTFTYDPNQRLSQFANHLGHTWTFTYDASNRLETIATPSTSHALSELGLVITDEILGALTVDAPRVTTLSYDDTFTNHLASILDGRGLSPRSWQYGPTGRVTTSTINNLDEVIDYSPSGSPQPPTLLDNGNTVVRVTDREGNVTDYEMHGPNGGSVAGKGRFGLRRKLRYTESGLGKAALRPGEPAYWEQRWLQNCDCLRPAEIGEPVAAGAAGVIYNGQGMPTNAPRTIHTYNEFRQALSSVYTDGTNSIRVDSTYQAGAYGNGDQFSRLLTRTDPRAFESSPLNAGQNFTFSYAYDTQGNLVRSSAPTVTQGVASAQTIEHTMTYNTSGQVTKKVDAAGNVTRYTYHSGSSVGGDVNTAGNFGGYLSSVTIGASGSVNGVLNLTTRYQSNALGLVTRKEDPMGRAYLTTFNDLAEVTAKIEPQVTLANGSKTNYETRHVYDAAGYLLMKRRSNLDVDGAPGANAWIDHSYSYDSIGNRLAESVEVDNAPANDLRTDYRYDGNDQLIVRQLPEGNREFRVYDERRLLLRKFYGVAPGAFPLDGYPASKLTTVGVNSVGYEDYGYDARQNMTSRLDGRGNLSSYYYDFYNRNVAFADPNGNGWTQIFDARSQVVSKASGEIGAGGTLVQAYARSYHRYDEAGRRHLVSEDLDLASDESALLDPSPGNSNYQSTFDARSRLISFTDANNNSDTRVYDSADRQVASVDALNNEQHMVYDANSNLVMLTELERQSSNPNGPPESYQYTFDYDELNRRTAQHNLGLNGNSFTHTKRYDYDSRNNRIRELDEEGRATSKVVDDQDRVLGKSWWNGDPLDQGVSEIRRNEYAYNRNRLLTEERTFKDVNNAGTAETTRYAYDTLDRKIRIVLPDSDDPIDGSDNGLDGLRDRTEIAYDENSNETVIQDPRGVTRTNTYDPGNRRTVQVIPPVAGVPGVRRIEHEYDALNRMTMACNDYAKIDRNFDSLSRLTSEVQSIRLDGTGFTNGWQEPVVVTNTYDAQSNRVGLAVTTGNTTDLAVTHSYDALNRLSSVDASYFDRVSQAVCDYDYLGPDRVTRKTLGNMAEIACSYDTKRRISGIVSRSSGQTQLTGLSYGYSPHDEVLGQQFAHDQNRTDHFQYNDLYELTGVDYRSQSQAPPANFTLGHQYDQVLNRTASARQDPFGNQTPTAESYFSNSANEYLQWNDGNNVHSFAHDQAGNTTSLPILPVTGDSEQAPVDASLVWDGLGGLFRISSDETGLREQYRYDPLGRRIATLVGFSNTPSKRFIYSKFSVVAEREFLPGATTSNAPSRLERIYIDGASVDEHLLCGIDRDGDGILGGMNNSLNQRDIDADQLYYFIQDHIGSTTAILDADNDERILEYYRYNTDGLPVVLPALEGAGGIEITPNDLSDNAQGAIEFSEEYGNPYLFAGRRYLEQSGLYLNRYRYYSPLHGRFLSRDPLVYVDSMNLLQYGMNSPMRYTDPTGLTVTCVGIGGAFVAGGGAGAGLAYCSDECGNWAIVLCVTVRLGADLNAGVFLSVAKGGLKDSVGVTTNDISGGLLFGGGVDINSDGEASGAHVGIAAGAGVSAGSGRCEKLHGDLSKPYPCDKKQEKKACGCGGADLFKRGPFHALNKGLNPFACGNPLDFLNPWAGHGDDDDDHDH